MKALVFTVLMAAVLTHMVEQRITMDARKAKMEMMKHIQMGKETVQEIIVRSRPAGDVNS
jgi:hypothetical protein